MIEQGDALITIHNLVDKVISRLGEAILSTNSPSGRPHATWMGTMAIPEDGSLITLTSPDSEKVRNIQANPKVEWLFTDEPKHSLVYLQGAAEVLEETAAIKRGWAAVADKERAYFLNYFNSGIGVAVIRTTVVSATLCLPRANEKLTFAWEEVRLGWQPEEPPPAPDP